MSTALARFNALPPDEAERELSACCSAPAWVRAVASGRPYSDLAGLQTAARAIAGLTWPDIAAALAGHPRIGERAGGEDRASTWSRREQAAVVTDPEAAAAAALVEANRDYEQRFGH